MNYYHIRIMYSFVISIFLSKITRCFLLYVISYIYDDSFIYTCIFSLYNNQKEARSLDGFFPDPFSCINY